MDRPEQALLETQCVGVYLLSFTIHLGVKDVVVVKALLWDATRLRYISTQEPTKFSCLSN